MSPIRSIKLRHTLYGARRMAYGATLMGACVSLMEARVCSSGSAEDVGEVMAHRGPHGPLPQSHPGAYWRRRGRRCAPAPAAALPLALAPLPLQAGRASPRAAATARASMGPAPVLPQLGCRQPAAEDGLL
jgi:hypothetical protein